MRNRSVPRASVIPEVAYPDVVEAAEWICTAFGFRPRLRIGTHRFQLVHDAGALIVVSLPAGSTVDPSQGSVLVLVGDVDSHLKRASAAGAEITQPLADYPFGERQYSARDPFGRHWTFSQSIADVDPSDWGGTAYDLDDQV
jgi:uncharacterized glyoxalase superfamily protein PhnB